MKFIALRKLFAGILVLLMATGVIQSDAVEKHKWLRTLLYVMGIILMIAAVLYQFGVIPESSQDAIFK